MPAAQGVAVTLSVLVFRLGRRIASQCSSAWTNRNAISFPAVSASGAARSARCPLRVPTRERSVHMTAAQPDVNGSPSAPDHCHAKLRNAENLSAIHHGRHSAYGPPQATPPQAQDTDGGTTCPGRSPRKNTSSFGTNREADDKPGTAPPQATPTVNQNSGRTHRPRAEP
jgi:hypothetical protein